MGNTKITRFDIHVKRKVVSEIVEGHLFVDEAMEKYDIKSKATIINWLRSRDKYYPSNI